MRNKISATLLIVSLTASAAYANQGTASYYTKRSCQREGTSGVWTASGERYNEDAFTCASWDYPFGTKLKITNLENNLSIIVTVNDRGPNRKLYNQGRTIDLSKAAFKFLNDLDLSKGIIPIDVSIWEGGNHVPIR